MKVYAVVGSWEYEGYAVPIGIYSSAALARQALGKACNGFDSREILEYELDAIAQWPEEIKPVEISLKE